MTKRANLGPIIDPKAVELANALDRAFFAQNTNVQNYVRPYITGESFEQKEGVPPECELRVFVTNVSSGFRTRPICVARRAVSFEGTRLEMEALINGV